MILPDRYPPFMLARDARGSLVHVRRRDDGECVGCIEVGLFEIVRALVLVEGGDGRKDGTRSGRNHDEG